MTTDYKVFSMFTVVFEWNKLETNTIEHRKNKTFQTVTCLKVCSLHLFKKTNFILLTFILSVIFLKNWHWNLEVSFFSNMGLFLFCLFLMNDKGRMKPRKTFPQQEINISTVFKSSKIKNKIKSKINSVTNTHSD